MAADLMVVQRNAGRNQLHCYVAGGGTRPCSGNQEEARGQFQACQAGYCYDTWFPTITESENYHGQFYG